MQFNSAKNTGKRTEISPTIGEQPTTRPMGFDVNLPMEAERVLRRQLSPAQRASDTLDLQQKISHCCQRIDGVLDPGSRSGEIADYIARLGKLYGHCLATARESEPVALAIFQQAIEHFNL
jgi:hypothetical protein